jgi:hypothetical protein
MLGKVSLFILQSQYLLTLILNKMKKLFLLIIVILFLSCSEDDNSLPSQSLYSVEFKTGVLPNYVSVILETTITLESNAQIIVNSDYNYTTNSVVVDLPENTKSFTCRYSIENSALTTVTLKDKTNNTIVDQFVLSAQTHNYSYTFN